MSPRDRSLDRLALRVLLASFPGARLPAGWASLLEEGLGGICLFGSNTGGGAEGVAALVAEIRAVSPDVVVAIDEEGGDVTRLHGRSGGRWLGAGALGAADDLALTAATARGLGQELAALGLDLCLAPVADVNSDPDNPVIGIRSFGADADRVAAHVAAWVAGLQHAGPAACAKHFPGHGDTHEDSHLALPTVLADESLLAGRELVPFRAAVAAGAAAVMTSHILVPALDDVPATFSPRVLGLLRGAPDRGGLGFDGVVVTDALDMAGASAGRGIPRAAVLSLAAGADLLCLGPDQDAGQVRAVQRAVLEAVRTGELGEARLRSAAARVEALAARGAPGSLPVEDHAAAQVAGARAAVRVEGSLPDLRGARVLTLQTAPNIAVGSVPWGLVPDVTLDPSGTTPAVAPAALDPGSSRGVLLVQVRDAHRHPDVLVLLEQLAASRPVVLVEWGWPGHLPGALSGLPRVIPFGSSRPSCAAVAELLAGAGWEAA